ncbi:MAG: (3R)-hydroxyacyl-ACP dehydratase subunit HadC [Mycolicibacterium hassiacum]|jgi:acyl dehydratase|uniref:(3R)-hydroxyacyl-ACP dehydratase subunit HadC n=1 Tax=Mycolicibacterium hassiacum TaxID=46351 RepID=UPI000DB53382|nr:(3R)-hydroxyacyl-ACP dehydratase subunit HadC [Mycolicibacterium hassiacum]MBX5486513.1 (3R)-hydroxyacyl-ACP dehydratase subunit HadC [Mycolicibacterium hassiacum]PZN24385.1 MAG: 3-hydroxyacyl-ACP dehydratase [Mycolicibacterium hassiacum]
MALKTDIRGMVWKYPDKFVVGREQIRQYANAVKAYDPATHDEKAAAELGHSGLVAPLTFMSIFAVMIQRHFFQHVDVGFETMQIVQVDQKFKFYRPIVDGDQVNGTMYIESVDERFGADIVTTRNVLTDQNGEVVMESFTTLMGHEGDNSISAGWDPVTGQVTRKPVQHDTAPAEGAENNT